MYVLHMISTYKLLTPDISSLLWLLFCVFHVYYHICIHMQPRFVCIWVSVSKSLVCRPVSMWIVYNVAYIHLQCAITKGITPAIRLNNTTMLAWWCWYPLFTLVTCPRGGTPARAQYRTVSSKTCIVWVPQLTNASLKLHMSICKELIRDLKFPVGYTCMLCVYATDTYPHITLGLLANAHTLLDGFTRHHMMIKYKEKDYLFAYNIEYCIE